MSDLLTFSDIRRLFPGESRNTIDYALRERGPEPARRIGICRLWRGSDVPAIRDAVEQSIANRTRPRASREGVLS